MVAMDPSMSVSPRSPARRGLARRFAPTDCLLQQKLLLLPESAYLLHVQRGLTRTWMLFLRSCKMMLTSRRWPASACARKSRQSERIAMAAQTKPPSLYQGALRKQFLLRHRNPICKRHRSMRHPSGGTLRRRLCPKARKSRCLRAPRTRFLNLVSMAEKHQLRTRMRGDIRAGLQVATSALRIWILVPGHQSRSLHSWKFALEELPTHLLIPVRLRSLRRPLPMDAAATQPRRLRQEPALSMSHSRLTGRLTSQ